MAGSSEMRKTPLRDSRGMDAASAAGGADVLSSGRRKSWTGLLSTQQQILAVVAREPGVVIDRLAQMTGSSYGNVTYHLQKLCQQGYLIREKQGRGVRHYLADDDMKRGRIEAYLRDPKKRAVLETLAARPNQEWVANRLAKHLGLYPAFLTRLVARLNDQGFVRVTRLQSQYHIRASASLVAYMREIFPEESKETP